MNRRVLLMLISLLLILLSGCSSLSTWVRANVEGVPVWVYEPQVARNQMAFVGSGSADSETRARVLAYESLLQQVSLYIGRDIAGDYIAELSNSDAIEAFKLRITQDFVKVDEEIISVYFLGVADSEVLQQARSAAEVLLLEQQQMIQRLNEEASQAFRDNRDTVAIEKYVQIAVISASMPVDRGAQQYERAVQQIAEILGQLTISVGAGDPAIPTTTVTVRRGSRPLSPRVIGAPVVALYEARDGLGKSYQDSQQSFTDSSGQISFIPDNPTIIGQGAVVFQIDLTKALQPLQDIDAQLYTTFLASQEKSRQSYAYSRVSLLGSQRAAVMIAEYSLQGQLLESDSAAVHFSSLLTSDGIRLQLVPSVSVEEDEELLATLQQQFPTYPAIFYGTVGISHLQNTGKGFSVTVTGETLFINLVRATVLGRSGTIRANAVAPTEEEATRAAFSRFGTQAASLLYRYLYRR
jgi:hypothetical protein